MCHNLQRNNRNKIYKVFRYEIICYGIYDKNINRLMKKREKLKNMIEKTSFKKKILRNLTSNNEIISTNN